MQKSLNPRHIYTFATIAGLIAVLAWSTSVAFSKSVMNSLGNDNAIFIIYTSGGLLMAVISIIYYRREYIPKLKMLSFKYFYTTGIFLLFTLLFFFIAISLTANQNELCIVTILNYQWAIFIYIIEILMFKPKIKIFLFVSGIILAFSGIVLSFMQAYNFNEIIRIFKGLDKNAFAYILAFLGAVSWGIYSNQIKKLQKVDDFVAMPLFFIATGLIFLIVIIVKGKFSLSEFNSIKPGFDLCYTIVFPTSTAYLCWNIAMKYGNKNLVTSVSFLIPLLSVLVIGIKYSGKFNFMIAYAAICLILGAIFSYFSIQRKKEIDPQHDRFSLKGIT